jgi:CysZ protein
MQLTAGGGYVLQGLALVRRPELRAFVVVPLLVNTLLFAGLIWLGYGQVQGLIEGFDRWIQRSMDLPGWLDWLEAAIRYIWDLLDWLVWLVFILVVLLIVFFTFTLVANIIAAPFNGLLAEKVERLLTGHPLRTSGDWKALIRSLGPTLWSEVRKLVYFVTRAMPVLLLFLIPGVNLLAPVAWFLFSAWMLALEYVDYPAGNHGVLFDEQRRGWRRRRGLALGFGSGVSALTLIPVVNFIAMPVAVAGATALYVEHWAKESGG